MVRFHPGELIEHDSGGARGGRAVLSHGRMSRRCHYVEHGGRRTQCVVLAVDVGPHGESCVRVPEPRRYDSDRDAPQVTGMRVPQVWRASCRRS
jgi:hypothetical protein